MQSAESRLYVREQERKEQPNLKVHARFYENRITHVYDIIICGIGYTKGPGYKIKTMELIKQGAACERYIVACVCMRARERENGRINSPREDRMNFYHGVLDIPFPPGCAVLR